MLKFLVLTILTFALAVPTLSQPDELPEPSEIFAPDIEVSPVEAFVFPDYGQLYSANHQTRTLRIRPTLDDEWQTFSFPEGWDFVNCVEPRSDGTWIIIASCGGIASGYGPIQVLNPETGLYSDPETICGSDVVVKAFEGEGEWVLSRAGGYLSLCFTETGELKGKLLEDLFWWEITTSPDKQYVALMTFERQSNQVIGTYSLYGYDVQNDELKPLGIVEVTVIDPDIQFGEWVSNTRGTIIEKDAHSSFPSHRYHAFDVTEPISLKRAFTGWRDHTFFNPQYKSYLTVKDQILAEFMTGASSDIPCLLGFYNESGVYEFELGYACVSIEYDIFRSSKVYPTTNHYFYLVTDSADAKVKTLGRFSPEDKVPIPLLTSQFDMILSVSPDERLIVLADVDYRISHEGTVIAIYDWQAEKFVYWSEPIGVNYANQVVWVDSATVVVAAQSLRVVIQQTDRGDYSTKQLPSSLRRIEISPEHQVKVMVTTTLGDWRYEDTESISRYISKDNRYWLTPTGVVDLWTLEYIQILQEDILHVELRWASGSELIAAVTNPENPDVFAPPLAVYQVQLP